MESALTLGLKASAGRCAAESYPKVSQTTKNTAKMTNKTQWLPATRRRRGGRRSGSSGSGSCVIWMPRAPSESRPSVAG